MQLFFGSLQSAHAAASGSGTPHATLTKEQRRALVERCPSAASSTVRPPGRGSQNAPARVHSKAPATSISRKMPRNCLPHAGFYAVRHATSGAALAVEGQAADSALPTCRIRIRHEEQHEVWRAVEADPPRAVGWHAH